jgi:hypothetical protein
LDEDYFSSGWIEYGTGATQQFRTISKSALVPLDTSTNTGRIQLALVMPLAGLTVGATVTLYPGCDGTRQMCKAKFDNWLNFGGAVMAPANLAIRAVNRDATNGNKK